MKEFRERWYVRFSFAVASIIISAKESALRIAKETLIRMEKRFPSTFGVFTTTARGKYQEFQAQARDLDTERGDVPGWVLVVLMTTGLVTAVWAIAAPRLSTILRNSLDAMNGIR